MAVLFYSDEVGEVAEVGDSPVLSPAGDSAPEVFVLLFDFVGAAGVLGADAEPAFSGDFGCDPALVGDFGGDPPLPGDFGLSPGGGGGGPAPCWDFSLAAWYTGLVDLPE